MFKWLGNLRLYLFLPGIALVLLSTIIFFSGWFWPWGWAAGFAMLAFSGKSDPEKKGYRF